MVNQASASPVAPAGAQQRLLRALNRFLEPAVRARWAARLPGLNIDDAGLIDHVEGELASYKAPRVIVVLDRLAPGGTASSPSPPSRDRHRLHALTTEPLVLRAPEAADGEALTRFVGGIATPDGAFLDAAPLVLCTPVTAP